MNWLNNHLQSEPMSAPVGLRQYQYPLQQPFLLTSPISPQTAARTRDPNATDYKYQVNQKCIYERELPGGSYITAHLQRLQSGFYESSVIHEDVIENVRFVAINFVFHPSRKDYRFKSAEISLALHHTNADSVTPLDRIRHSLVPDHTSDHDRGTQTETTSHALVRSKDFLPIRQRRYKPATCRPKFIRHAPHLLYGAVSPETLDWNFNVAGSVGVSQGPATASFNPSYGLKGSYKLYEMMKIQGSVRTLRSWLGATHHVEDGEIVWTLEENRLQKSGLPREFTFVMLLTKGSGGFEPSDDVTLNIDIHPKVSGPMGGTYPSFVTGLHRFKPFRDEKVDLDQEIGQKFEPCIAGRGFNFANLASKFDDFVWLPGTTYSATDNPEAAPTSTQQQQQSPSQSQQQPKQIGSPTPGDTTLNLRVFLENARGSPIPMANSNQNQYILPGLHLKAPSRNPSPLPPSVTGSHRSNRRSITINSAAPGSSRPTNHRHSYAAPSLHAEFREASGSSTNTQPQPRQVSHSHSLRKTRSRSGLDKEYVSSESPRESKTQSQTFHDAHTGISPQSEPGDGPDIEREPVNDENTALRYGDEIDNGLKLRYGDERADLSYPDAAQQDEHLDGSASHTPGPLQAGYSTPSPRERRFPSLAYDKNSSQRTVDPGQESEMHSSPEVGHQESLASEPVTASVTDTDGYQEPNTQSRPGHGQGQTSATADPEDPTGETPIPSTPSWHQHTSSLSPPSSGSTQPPTYTNPAPESLTALPQSQPISTPARSSLDSTVADGNTNWNDTPPDWLTPTGSGSNTPTRNRSFRTRKATQRALVYQDQLLSQQQALRDGVARSASLDIRARPDARARQHDRESSSTGPSGTRATSNASRTHTERSGEGLLPTFVQRHATVSGPSPAPSSSQSRQTKSFQPSRVDPISRKSADYTHPTTSAAGAENQTYTSRKRGDDIDPEVGVGARVNANTVPKSSSATQTTSDPNVELAKRYGAEAGYWGNPQTASDRGSWRTSTPEWRDVAGYATNMI